METKYNIKWLQLSFALIKRNIRTSTFMMKINDAQKFVLIIKEPNNKTEEKTDKLLAATVEALLEFFISLYKS